MKKTLTAVLIVLISLIAISCTMEGGDIGTITKEDQETFNAYVGSFGHVRVLGDIDHILKGEKVDDEEGVTVQSMTAGAVAFNDTKTELTIPLTLTDYDFDGHRNPEDPDPEKYTRTATGAVTLVLTGAMNADGTAFVANGYKLLDADITLDVDDSTYIWLDLPEMKVTADELAGIFTTSGGVAKATLSIAVDGGKAVGITDVNTPKFGTPAGIIAINGVETEYSAL